ncbi:MAG: hypothetical protein Q8P56_02715, partial [Candidatus Uhrbacteria bacterium]|nr:hypothetical protein [Candidatus Uhrbacteria bacterium]
MTYSSVKIKVIAYGLCIGMAVFVFVAFSAVRAQQTTSAPTESVGSEITRSIPQSGGSGQYVTIMG